MDPYTLYTNKCATINSELSGPPARKAKALITALAQSLAITILAAESFARVTDAFGAAVSHLTLVQKDIVANRELQARLAAGLQSVPVGTMAGLENMANIVRDNIDLQLVLNGHMQVAANHTYDLLELSLCALLAEEDNAPREAFADAIRSGIVDFGLGKIPGVDLLIIGLRAIDAALTARSKRRKSAHEYLYAIETYNEAGQAWISGAEAVAEGFDSLGKNHRDSGDHQNTTSAESG